MKVGDLVKLKSKMGTPHRYCLIVGLVVDLPEYDLVVEVLWSDGKRGQINTKYLEVINENREQSEFKK
jgi:hypothetical protein